MVKYQKIECDKCDSSTFDYDSYWNEYSCRKCGQIVENAEKASLLDGARERTFADKNYIKPKISDNTKSSGINGDVAEPLNGTLQGESIKTALP